MLAAEAPPLAVCLFHSCVTPLFFSVAYKLSPTADSLSAIKKRRDVRRPDLKARPFHFQRVTRVTGMKPGRQAFNAYQHKAWSRVTGVTPRFLRPET